MLLALAFLLTVSIPSLGMTAQTEPLHVVDGQLSVPVDPDRIGVYSLSGNTLLVGHVDWAGRLRAFAGLKRLQINDSIILSDDSIILSNDRAYHVSWIGTYAGDDLETWRTEVIAPADDVLTLVTCTGVFDRQRGEYLDRLVVRASRD